MQRLIFTAIMTCISRVLIFRNGLCGKHQHAADENTSVCIATEYYLASGNNILHALFMQPAEIPVKAVFLICHGIGETVFHWRVAQQLMAENGIASLIFDYSGYGQSSGWIEAKQCETDAIAAFTFLSRRMPSVPITLLGFSLGGGVATAVMAKVAADRLILCASYTSLRKAAGCISALKPLTFLVPKIWNTEEALRTCRIPVLVVHGEKDELFPPQMACSLAAACQSSCELILIPGLSHDAPVYQRSHSYWRTIAERLDTSDPRSLPI